MAKSKKKADQSVKDKHKKKVGGRLRVWRKDNGLTLKKIANKIKVTLSSLSTIERGVHFPSYGIIYKLKKTYKVADWDTILFK